MLPEPGDPRSQEGADDVKRAEKEGAEGDRYQTTFDKKENEITRWRLSCVQDAAAV